MPNSIENKKLIESFFYGELPEKERFEFEERFVSDAALFDEVKAFEDDLIESYVRGWMGPVQRSIFEQKFLTTDKRRERVEFSHVLIEKVNELSQRDVAKVANSVYPADHSIWEKLGAFLFSPKIALTAAAALIAAGFGGWVLYQSFSGSGIETVKNPDPTVIRTPESTFSPTPNSRSQDLTPENGETADNPNSGDSTETNDSVERVGTNQMGKPTPEVIKPRAEKPPVTTKTPIPPRTVNPPNPVIALFPGLVRSGGKLNELSLADGAKGATLRLNLESVDYKVYEARLSDASGNVIYQKEDLTTARSKVSVFVSSRNLKKGDYILKLYGKNAAGENESVADYQFRVN